MIGCIIQARMGSSRLPVKVMEKLDEDNTVLSYVIRQLKHSKFLDDIVVATTSLKRDEVIVDFLENEGIKYFCGDETDKDWIRIVRKFWESRGAKVSEMDAESHDQMFASVSHLPHLLAYACIQAISNTDTQEALGHSGAGLKDFSRIASSSPQMWADIFLENQENLLPRVAAFKEVLSALEETIKKNDKKNLVELLALSKNVRDRWMA